MNDKDFARMHTAVIKSMDHIIGIFSRLASGEELKLTEKQQKTMKRMANNFTHRIEGLNIRLIAMEKMRILNEKSEK